MQKGAGGGVVGHDPLEVDHSGTVVAANIHHSAFVAGVMHADPTGFAAAPTGFGVCNQAVDGHRMVGTAFKFFTTKLALHFGEHLFDVALVADLEPRRHIEGD